MPVRRRIAAAIILAVAVVAVAATGWAIGAHAASTKTAVASPPPVATTLIVRKTLTNSTQFDGTLSYGAASTVTGPATGTVTELPVPGVQSAQGQSLFRVDDTPIPVFYGAIPLYRPLGSGIQGADVAMVESNLAELGYLHGVVASNPELATWTFSVTRAVRHWQTAERMPVTGTLTPGQVVVFPGPVRVDSVIAQVGQPAATPLIAVTGTIKNVQMSIQVSDAANVVVGAPVSILRPDGREVSGTITTVGSVAQIPTGNQPAASSPPMLEVTVRIDHLEDVSDLSYSPVEIDLTTETRRNVLAVPTDALLALREGGYAIQTPDGKLFAVKTGMFTDDDVQVSGAGISAGMRIVEATP